MADWTSGRRWRDLSPRLRRAAIVVGTVQVSLWLAAQIDISRRSADRIKGPRWRWRLISMISVVGPITYFRYGRRTG